MQRLTKHFIDIACINSKTASLPSSLAYKVSPKSVFYFCPRQLSSIDAAVATADSNLVLHASQGGNCIVHTSPDRLPLVRQNMNYMSYILKRNVPSRTPSAKISTHNIKVEADL